LGAIDVSTLFKTQGSPAKPDYTGLQIQTSTNILPVPLFYGANKGAPNVIWFGDFTITPPSGGGGGGKGDIFGGGGSGSSEYTYTAALVLALCEGPIFGIGYVWKDQSVYTLAELGLSLIVGNTPQAPWSFLTSAFPEQALGYNGTALLVSSQYQLGDTATLSNHNFEIFGILHGTGFNGIDADPAQLVNDFITNTLYGAAAATGVTLQIDTGQLYGTSGDGSYQSYCAAAGLALSPALTSQESAQSILQRWLQLTNTAGVWSPGVGLKLVPFGDEMIPANQLRQLTESRAIQPPQIVGNDPTVTVSFRRQFVADDGVTYSQSGHALAKVTGAPAPGQYSVAGGIYTFNPADQYSVVDVAYQYANPVGFTPNLTVVYQLDDDDFLEQGKDTDPVSITRSDPYEAHNVERLNICQRDNAYANIPIEARDQDAVERHGMRIDAGVQATEICDQQVGATAAQLILQRGLYIRNNFKFQLPWEFCLLEPMDLVDLTQLPRLNNQTVRITDIEEDDAGILTFTAEEMPIGVATAALYPVPGAASQPINRNAGVDPVNTPIVFEPNAQLLAAFGGSLPEVWIAASGGEGGVADPNWGGAFVWLSLDGTSFGTAPIGTVTAPAQQGMLTATLPNYSGSNPDTADTISVSLAESGGIPPNGSSPLAQAGLTLCYVDGEIISYETVTLAGADLYDITTLYRGFYGSTIGSHANSSAFTLLNNAMFRYVLPSTLIGKTLYLKLQSFNSFGGAVQDISTCTVYAYTPSGPAAPGTPSSLSAVGATGSAALSCVSPNSPSFVGVQFYRSAHGTGFASSVPVGALVYGAPNATLTYTDTVAAGTYDYFATSQNSSGVNSSPAGPATATVT
jgi:hypothetical protein